MQIVIRHPADLDSHARQIRLSADRAVGAIKALVAHEPDSLQILNALRFTEMGRHPLEDRPLNLVEQLNQTSTCLVAGEAARFVLERHPESEGIRLNMAAASGLDLESLAPGIVAAEVFAATRPQSNDKLRKDLARLATMAAAFRFRYVFFHAPGYTAGRQPSLETAPGIEVWSLNV
ncbi:MAG: hypothetical protein IH605_01015 [Burkholderiales bacterium]|nr:hypothetical protein [Burkholderiales bacterium]